MAKIAMVMKMMTTATTSMIMKLTTALLFLVYSEVSSILMLKSFLDSSLQVGNNGHDCLLQGNSDLVERLPLQSDDA